MMESEAGRTNAAASSGRGSGIAVVSGRRPGAFTS